MNENILIKIAKDRELTGRDKNVLLYVLGRCAQKGICDSSQRDISREISIAQPDVSNALKRITQSGYVLTQKVGNRHVYTTHENLMVA